MQEQNFKNHTRIIILYHVIAFAAILAVLGFSISFLIKAVQNKAGLGMAIMFLLTGFVLLILFWYARSFALKAQDRAIRAEENLRHFALTGKLLDKRLTIGQIIALRFAPDEEFAALAQKAAETGMSGKDIKMAVQNWRADYHRV
jgi:Family of unknown function (DUF6526)